MLRTMKLTTLILSAILIAMPAYGDQSGDQTPDNGGSVPLDGGSVPLGGGSVPLTGGGSVPLKLEGKATTVKRTPDDVAVELTASLTLRNTAAQATGVCTEGFKLFATDGLLKIGSAKIQVVGICQKTDSKVVRLMTIKQIDAPEDEPQTELVPVLTGKVTGAAGAAISLTGRSQTELEGLTRVLLKVSTPDPLDPVEL